MNRSISESSVPQGRIFGPTLKYVSISIILTWSTILSDCLMLMTRSCSAWPKCLWTINQSNEIPIACLSGVIHGYEKFSTLDYGMHKGGNHVIFKMATAMPRRYGNAETSICCRFIHLITCIIFLMPLYNVLKKWLILWQAQIFNCSIIIMKSHQQYFTNKLWIMKHLS